MNASFEYRLTADEYASGLRSVMTHILAEYRKKSWAGWEGWIAVMAAAALGYLLQPDAWNSILLVIFIVMIGGWIVNTRQVRQWHLCTFEPQVAEYRTRIDEAGFVSQRGAEESRYQWSAVRNVQELPDAIVLIFLGWGHLLLPNRLFASDVARSAFVENIRDSSPNLRPDLPAAATGNPAILLGTGALAAGVIAFLILNAATIWILIDRISGELAESRTSSVIWSSGLATAVFLGLSTYAGWLIYQALARTHAQRPRVASTIAAGLIAIFAAILVLYFMLTCGRC